MDTDLEEALAEEPPSLRAAARTLYARRHDPSLEVDMRIATAMGGVMWIGGALLAAVMLLFAPPTQTIGPSGWALAGATIGVAVGIGVIRIGRRRPSQFGSLFAGSLVALLGVAFLEWLTGGRDSPQHVLFAFPLLYAAAVQPRRRALLVLVLVCVVVWAPLLYAPSDPPHIPDTAGQLLLLIVLSLVGRIVFTLLRAQRAGLRQARRQAEELARRDSLTGLGNRLALEEALAVEVARSRRQQRPLSLLVGDLDDFKEVNERLGHSGGDDCLRRVAVAISEVSRTEDQCFRWGGDEFVVILPDTDAASATEVRRRVCSAASEACPAPVAGAVRLTCGTAQLAPGDAVEDLLVKADEVVLDFKHRSRGQPARGEPGEAA